MARLRATFQTLWGYEDFRSPQGEIAQSILSGKDCVIIMPTGGGKSVCFQLPALMQFGVTLVISPLVALMENQVQELAEKGLPAAALHSELDKKVHWQTLRSLQNNRLRLLYLSPETLLSKPVWEVLYQPQVTINALVLDEAHCLTQWGDSFRPAYRRLGAVRSTLIAAKPAGTKIAIAAFTATADPHTQAALLRVLRLQNPQLIRLNPYRSNLHLSVKTVWTPSGRKRAMLGFIQRHGKQAGIVYARTRRGTESLAQWFAAQGYSVRAYHGGLAADQRRLIEAQWISGDCQFVVCTSAFGMGINKPDCRFVIHYEVPSLLAEYVQEVGRGGRDGKPARALSLVSEPTGLFAPEDKRRWQFFEQKAQQLEKAAAKLVHRIPTKGHIDQVRQQFADADQALALLHRKGQLRWLDPFTYQIEHHPQPQRLEQLSPAVVMQRYLFTQKCRWQVLLEEFGFAAEAKKMHCGKCDRCQSQMSS
ncbi:MAG: ATP-dependent DNA helicase RecQ [Phormidesmis sp. RL_2_1]|nr:ATP-dependent DNA helicase RecQ [Phormidesmis sp. RL_2_1]